MPAQSNPRHERLAMLLARGASHAAAARAAGCSPRTVQRRVLDPFFRERVDELRQSLIGRTTAKLSAYSVSAAKRLHALAKTGSGATAVSAAKALLELGLRFRSEAIHAAKDAEIDRRLKALEAERLKVHGAA